MALQTLKLAYVIALMFSCLDNTTQVIYPWTDPRTALRRFFAALVGAQRAANIHDHTGVLSRP